MSVVVGKCDLAMGVRNWEWQEGSREGPRLLVSKPLTRLHHLHLPKNVTNWGPNIQMSETMENIFLSNQHTTFVYSQ